MTKILKLFTTNDLIVLYYLNSLFKLLLHLLVMITWFSNDFPTTFFSTWLDHLLTCFPVFKLDIDSPEYTHGFLCSPHIPIIGVCLASPVVIQLATPCFLNRYAACLAMCLATLQMHTFPYVYFTRLITLCPLRSMLNTKPWLGQHFSR